MPPTDMEAEAHHPPDRHAPVRILVVDDHPLMREGIAAVIGSHEDMQLVADARTGREAVDMYLRHRPDVTLMDVRMPEKDGIDALAEIRQADPEARVIVLTTYKGDVQALRAIRGGAMGYLLKDMLRTELVTTIREVAAGRRRFPAEVSMLIAQHAADDQLSRREVEVLRAVSLGGSNKRIATDLSITEETVKAHMRSILSKLDANDRTHAVTIALKRGIIE